MAYTECDQILFYYLYYWPKKMHINSGKVFRYSFFPSVTAGIVALAIDTVRLKANLLDW